MIGVSDHLDSCPELHPEVNEMGGLLPYLAESLEPIEPPAWLRESVIAAAKTDLAARVRAGELAARPAAEPVVAPVVAPAAVSGPLWRPLPPPLWLPRIKRPGRSSPSSEPALPVVAA